MLNKTYPFALPALTYPYNSLEPNIDVETMYIHHDKHFKTYVDNLNAALEAYPALQKLSLKQLLLNPKSLPVAVNRNAGGVYNHNLFFERIGPSKLDNGPSGAILDAINNAFGSFERFKDTFSESAKNVFGSGWTYLCLSHSGGLKIINTRNQETPLPMGYTPVILFDVWEHAYYLKYKNDRADYIKNLWNVVNWS